VNFSANNMRELSEPSQTLKVFHVPDQPPSLLPVSQGPTWAQPRPSVPARHAQGLHNISPTLGSSPGKGTLLALAHIALKRLTQFSAQSSYHLPPHSWRWQLVPHSRSLSWVSVLILGELGGGGTQDETIRLAPLGWS